MGFLVFLIVGGLAGWIASIIVGREHSMGILANIVVGWIGAGLMNFVFGSNIALSDPTLNTFLLAIVGATGLLFLVNLLVRNSR